jgi:hypothetical protein
MRSSSVGGEEAGPDIANSFQKKSFIKKDASPLKIVT